MMKNLDQFDEFAALIFAQLFDGFPVKQMIDARRFSGHADVDDYGGIVDERGQPSRRFAVAIATAEWLIDSGYVRAGNRNVYGFDDAVLTPAGLAALNAKPESLSSRESIGARIVRFVREGSMGFAKEAAKAAIGAGVGSIVGS